MEAVVGLCPWTPFPKHELLSLSVRGGEGEKIEIALQVILEIFRNWLKKNPKAVQYTDVNLWQSHDLIQLWFLGVQHDSESIFSSKWFSIQNWLLMGHYAFFSSLLCEPLIGLNLLI